MADTRFPYGLAFGRINAFQVLYQGATAGVFAEADSSPDVTIGCLFYSNNSTLTTITHFDLSLPGAGAGGGGGSNAGMFEGKYIKVLFLDSQTTLSQSSVLQIGATGTFYNPPSNSSMDFIYHNSAWYEVARGNATNAGGNKTITVTVGGTTTVNVRDASIVLVNATATSIIHQFIGGRSGQMITVIPNSGGSTYQFTNSSGNIHIAGTANFVASLTAGYQFVCRDGVLWSGVSMFA